MSKKIGIFLALVMCSVHSLFLSSAHAETPIFMSNSQESRTQPANMNYRYELIGMSVTVMKDNPGSIIFKANFASAVSATTFLPYGTSVPFLQIKILNRLTDYKDQNGDVWLQAPTDRPYKGSEPIDALGSKYRDPSVGPAAGRVDLAECKPKTWMDAGATSNWVAFSIDRNCADINDVFWATAYIDSDRNASSYIFDSKWAPNEPMYVDMRGLPRPPKMLNQTVSFTAVPGTQNLEFPNTTISASSSQGIQPSFATLTPTTCTVAPSGNIGQIKLLASGICRIEAWAEGNTTVNPSPRIQHQFQINPIVKVTQRFSYYEPYDVTEGDPEFEINISSNSGLPLVLKSLNASVCYFKDPTNRPRLVTIFGPGVCAFTVSQEGNAKYYAASASASFDVAEKYIPEPNSTTSPTPKPKPKPTQRTLDGGSGGSEGGATSLGAQDKSGEVAQKAKAQQKIKCKKPNSKVIKTFTGTKCPKGYVKP